MKVKLSLIFFVLLYTTIPTSAQIKYHSPRRIDATFQFEIVAEDVDFDREYDLKYWSAVPNEDNFQKRIEILDRIPPPQRIEQYIKHESQFGFWDLNQQNRKSNFSVTFEMRADLYEAEYLISPESVPDNYNREDPAMVSYYTRNDSLAFISSNIREIAQQLAQGVSDPLVKARNIYRWVIQHLEPTFPIEGRGTRYLLSHPLDAERKIYGGDSAEYSWIFIALCRALDIPARAVNGFLTKPGFETPHTWIEYYLPKYGWISADPFLGDSEDLMRELTDQNDAYFYFTHQDNYHLAFYKGSNFQLKDECNYQHEPFFVDHHVWYAPIGIWNFEKFQNVNGSLSVNFEAFIVEEFSYPALGLQFETKDKWLQLPDLKKGVYELREKFISMDKSIELSLAARKLPVSMKQISAKQAAQLEIKSLKKLDRSYQIVEENLEQIDKIKGYRYVAEVVRDREQQIEQRLYMVEQGYLIWFVMTTSQNNFERSKAKIESIVSTLKVNIPERR